MATYTAKSGVNKPVLDGADGMMQGNIPEAQADVIVSADARPSPVSGMDMFTYRMNIARALTNPDDPGIPNGFIQWVNFQGGRGANSQQKRDKEFRDLIFRLMINENLRRLYEEQRELLDAWRKEKENNDRIRQDITATEQRMAELEKHLAKDKDGNTDWGKEAERILGDDPTQRRAGETEQQYQARMKKMLQDEVLDANGKVKAKYRDDPAAKWLEEEQNLIRLRKELDISNKKMEELERKLAENRRQILEELAKQKGDLETRTTANDEMLAQLRQIRSAPTQEANSRLQLFLQNRPELDIKFSEDDTVEQKIQKVQTKLEQDAIDIQREQVHVAEQEAAQEEIKKEVTENSQNRDAALDTAIVKNDKNAEDDFEAFAAGEGKSLTKTFTLAHDNLKPQQSEANVAIQIADQKSDPLKPFNPGAMV